MMGDHRQTGKRPAGSRASGSLYGLVSIAYKEVLHIRRDPGTLLFALVVPLLQLILFGYAVDFDVRHIRTAVIDLDRSRESRQYVQSLVNTQYLDVVTYLQTPDDATVALKRNTVRVAVVIPPDFSRHAGSSHAPQVNVMVDGSDSQVANPARLAVAETSGPLKVDVRLDVLYNPDARTQVYTIPGLLAVILQLVTVALTSSSLVREREQGTLEQLMVTPVGRLAIMVGKLLPYSVLATLELVILLFVARMVFYMPLSGSVLLLLALSVPFILAALSLGLVISAIASTQAQALQMAFVTTLPAILLSGYIAPRETLPGLLYVLGNLLPVTYFIQMVRGILVRGAGLTDLLPQTASLLFITVFLIWLATSQFRKYNV